MTSRLEPPREVWRAQSADLMHATRETQERASRLVHTWLDYPRHPPPRQELVSGRALEYCTALCGACGGSAAWPVVRATHTCPRCGAPYWPPGRWEAASLVLRVSGDFDEFNRILADPAGPKNVREDPSP